MMDNNELMNELSTASEYQEWLAERDAEAMEHEVEEFDYIEYCDYMSELIAMATARDCDEFMN